MSRRAKYVAAAVATMGAGMFTHFHTSPPLSIAARDVIGDGLWAMMIVWWVAALFPALSIAVRGGIAYGVCILVELSQAVHAPWLDAARHSFAGHLVLGSDFDPRDLLSYAGGVLVALLLDRITRR